MRKSRPAPQHHGSAVAVDAISGIQPTRPLPFAVGRSASLTINGLRTALQRLHGIVACSLRPDALVTIAPGEMMVVGYSIDTLESRWDDFKGVGIGRKVVVMLVRDPPVPDLRNGTQLDVTRFRGKAMTYDGRWTDKAELHRTRASRPDARIHPQAKGRRALGTLGRLPYRPTDQWRHELQWRAGRCVRGGKGSQCRRAPYLPWRCRQGVPALPRSDVPPHSPS